jgi:hypothetical protein
MMRRNFASSLKVVNGRLEPKHRPQRLRGEGKPKLYLVKFGGVRSPKLQPDNNCRPAVSEDKTPKGTAKPFVQSRASRAIFRYLERTGIE